ncbi:hypothetical protein [Nocardia veterana]|uniref:Uncharacterized protein n=1 Tax=Nocardia veterana TaxID=132249 RepID=A0A7X6LZB9_9NOCA|nr:hypothetical protein [Nocardia veterana]NKY86547.1 hypothetical protein [Nocardia veterana]
MELAAAFLSHQGAASTAIVIVPQMQILNYSSRLQRFSQNRTVLTPQNAHQSRIGYGHPALVYAPALKELELAQRYTRDQPIAVVEDPSFSCAAWADEIGAINLVERQVHSVSRSADHQKLLERIDFAGNNGWGDAPGKRDLRRYLAELAEIGALNKEEIMAHQLVHGRHCHYKSLTYLSDEIDRASS